MKFGMVKSQEQEKLTGFKKFQALTQTKSYKTFMAYIYGWGASIVMIGAYFKLTHIPGADSRALRLQGNRKHLSMNRHG